ncbi:MAG: hypothetical protein AVDCRST_MAG19-317 [uncultured Thermomicrobiales bacterium]|uniref:Polysaccharide biosynthesis protein C-terminal domain-containing protein n=1 Tax=uncultured Thermomicrobiales bacterium TaxID=1645740 RepID=A0A6J4UCW5_9BACT|nr:MAG: hypothetical protein AVDCRST_MAG19-317 [uncultured Thermomicrobiales bacterium]
MRRPRSAAFSVRSPDATTVVGGAASRSLPMHLNSIALILGKMATLGVGFLVWLIAARLLPPAEVGLASGAVSAMMLCVQLALFGAGAAVITLFPRYQDRPAGLLDTAIGVVGVASLVAAVAFLVLASGLFHELRVVAALPGYAIAFVAMCALGTLGVLFDQIGTALRRGDQVLVRGAVFGVVTLGIVVGLPLGGGVTDAGAILAAWVGGGLTSVALGYVQLRRSLPAYRYRPRLHRRLAAQLIGVGLPNWALTVTERAPGSILPIMVTELLSPETNAIWYAVWMMAWVVYVIPVQVGLSLFAEAAHRPDDLGLAVRRGLGLSLAVGAMGAVGAAIVGPFMLSFLGPGYAEGGTTPLRILAVAVFPFAFVQAYFSACRSRQQLAEAIITGTCSGLVGVGAAAAAGLAYGLRGMAVAWLLTQVVTGAWALLRLRSMSGASQHLVGSRRDATGVRPGTDVVAGLPATDSAVL